MFSVPPKRRLGRFGFVSLKANLQHPIAQSIAVEWLYGYHSLVVVGHGHEAETLALARLQVANHFHRLHCSEGAEELPEHILLGFGRQIINKDTPSGSGHCVAWQYRVGQQITSQWWVSLFDSTTMRKRERQKQISTHIMAVVTNLCCMYIYLFICI